MSAPYPYRAKGTGDVRQIFHGDVLIGTIEKRGRDVVKVCGNLSSSVNISKVRETWWRASWPDGSPVVNSDGKRRTAETIARWRTPNLWRAP